MDEHHVHVYASKNNGVTIVKTDRPPDLFRNSIATPSLVAAIMNGKYTNHLPMDRQAKSYEGNGVKLKTNTMANWMMNAADLYLNSVYEELHKQLLNCRILYADDETPLRVICDGRAAGSESQMWIYRTADCDNSPPVILYDYAMTRKAEHPDQFLKGFSGTLVTMAIRFTTPWKKQRTI